MVSETQTELLQVLLICETRVWQALVSGDATQDAKALAEDFLGVYPDGFAGKSDHVGQLDHGPTVATFELSGSRVLRLGEGHALLAYKARYMRLPSHKHPSPEPETMYVSSIWKSEGDSWVNVFSQDTPEGDGVV